MLTHEIQAFLPAIAWLIVSIILLSIPGDDLPKSKVFDIPFFDKYIHTTMFFLLTTLFSFPFIYSYSKSELRKWFLSVALLAPAYGILMEFVQKYFIPGRSFDVGDIMVDALGCTIGYFFTVEYLVKKIGPDGNQGRNQN